MIRHFLDGRVSLHHGDCVAVLMALDGASVDSVVCDPPYELGFMGRGWDRTGIANSVDMWREVLRVLKPGGHLLAFSGTRTYHRMVCAIEDAGFEIRDQIGWAFGQGFPKSHNAGAGWGTALKPAWEPIVLARKPLVGTIAANVQKHGTGALNIDGCRVPTESGFRDYVLKTARPNTQGEPVGNKVYGNLGGGVTNVSDLGRWPANLVHDGSPEVMAAFPESDLGPSRTIIANESIGYGGSKVPFTTTFHGGEGSAARFFYTAKADAEDRLGSKHPTVKPLDLMQWLVRLVTPRGGVVLDPFAGTGTTGEAAWREGMRAVLIEREPEYIADIERRMALADNPTKRAAVAATKNNLERPEDLPLFASAAD